MGLNHKGLNELHIITIWGIKKDSGEYQKRMRDVDGVVNYCLARLDLKECIK